MLADCFHQQFMVDCVEDDDFAVGKDIYKEKRHRITDIIYKFKDANSCKRIVELSEMTV